MLVRNVGKWLCVALSGWVGVVAASCGGGGSESVFHDAGVGSDSSVVTDGTTDGTTGMTDSPTLVGRDTGPGSCVPKKCKAGDCGDNLDGCNGQIHCGTCAATERCGCGATDNGVATCGVCGANGDDGGDGSTSTNCTATTCLALGFTCGFAADGCGNVLDCNGDAGGCTPPQFCGGGGFNLCGGNNGLTPDGGVPCTPTTCLALGFDCGYGNDGCGNLLDCTGGDAGGCPSPQYCGGGGFNRCGGNSGLSPDGASNCKPTTCAALGFNCGPAGDGCGGQLNCDLPPGGCIAPDTCGGAGMASQCGNTTCTNLCLKQQKCDGGTTTTITGTVIAGTPATYGTPDPVPNVKVYVPNGQIQPLVPRSVQPVCSQCGAEVTGNPLVIATTAFDGTFTLTNVPVGTNIPVVIQLGRWRRSFVVNVPACTSTSIGNLVMPHNQGEGDIPFTAVSTGSVDALECVMLKMGVDAAEFTAAGGGGRVNIYAGDTGSGAGAGAGTTNEEALMGNGGTYDSYDQILFPCWGGEYMKPDAELGNLVTYANTGGHFFATHFSYTWLFQNNPFNTTATFNVNHSSVTGPDPFTVQLPPTNPEGTIFSNWLHLVGGMPNPQTVQISYPRHDVNNVLGQSVNWISGKDPKDATPMQLHYTFDTPIGAAATSQCGHVIFSDFHVANVKTTPKTAFPGECDNNPLTAQEKILEYAIWDLSSCVGPPAPPACTPTSCMAQNITCGPAADGCGGLIASCGACTPPQTCGGGGVLGQCGAPDGGACSPKTCLDQNITCGPAGDGCGGEIANCGMCTPPQTCGGGGVPGQCGYPDAAQCAPETCAQQNIFCGPAGDGCGNEIPSCGTCKAPQTCGGGGIPGQCGQPDAGSCTPKSCAAQNVQCGTVSDQCGNLLQCPLCPSGQACDSVGQCQMASQ